MADIDSLFEKEQDIMNHLHDIGVILLDISDSAKDKLSQKDTNDVKDLLTTFGMNCEAMIEDVSQAEGMLKKIKSKQVTVKGTNENVAELKQHLGEVKTFLQKLKQNASAFLTARDRDMIFKEMNKDYSEVLAALTELMAESV